ncbi:hypothetical protein K402DRAFT_400351 [Aulographum hederae CBS 113979]|uniref:Uncharacterized protein n=1 Tax=Aulographum hederae CBS 113979 TaxID=1176131 RepID=A0A6G1HF41_9PEZI|nr:hypothetical protein K402DRAFT_400351 [Aulographum hederae CBS 113979]
METPSPPQVSGAHPPTPESALPSSYVQHEGEGATSPVRGPRTMNSKDLLPSQQFEKEPAVIPNDRSRTPQPRQALSMDVEAASTRKPGYLETFRTLYATHPEEIVAVAAFFIFMVLLSIGSFALIIIASRHQDQVCHDKDATHLHDPRTYPYYVLIASRVFSILAIGTPMAFFACTPVAIRIWMKARSAGGPRARRTRRTRTMSWADVPELLMYVWTWYVVVMGMVWFAMLAKWNPLYCDGYWGGVLLTLSLGIYVPG